MDTNLRQTVKIGLYSSVLFMQSYTAGVFASGAGAKHVIRDASRSIYSVILFALGVGLDSDSYLLQNIRLNAAL